VAGSFSGLSRVGSGLMKKILLRDNDPDFLFFQGEELSRASYHVICKLDAESALSVFAQDIKIDLVIITEYQMPGLLLVSFMAMLRMRKVPIIVLSGFCNVNVYLKAMRFGAYEYVSKPVMIGELMRIVNAALAPSQAVDPVSVHEQ
jgi:DNA-binding NtrC family response regulator